MSCTHSDDIDSFVTMDVTAYNEKINEWTSTKQSFVIDPLLITRELFRNDDFERRTIIEFQSEHQDQVTVTLTQEGLSDDAVEGEKRIIKFKRTNGTWVIEQIRLGFKCWESRGGHTNYSGIPCS